VRARGILAGVCALAGACGGSLVESDSQPSSTTTADDVGDDVNDDAASIGDTTGMTSVSGSTSATDPTGTSGPSEESSSAAATTTIGDDTSAGTSGGPVCGGLVWAAQMDVDPTTLDDNGDGGPDWSFDGGAFPMGALVGGVWQAGPSTRLVTEPEDTFAGRVIIDLTMRTVETGLRGATFGINTGLDDASVAGVLVNVGLDANGLQTVTIGGRVSAEMATPLVTVPDLDAELVDIHLDVDVDASQVAVVVEAVDYGAFALPTYDGVEPPHAQVGAGNLAAEIDSITIERCAP
jgi:hypothetical protein